jgi:hypothetical protein
MVWYALISGGPGWIPSARAGESACPYLRMHACEDRHPAEAGLVAAVNAVIHADILVPTAARVDCAEHRLPGSRDELVALLPEQHRRLIGECARGRTAVKRGLNGFDLLALVEDQPDQTADTATIREFFDSRAVDVAVGKACSDGPYSIAFDWAVVLDRDSHTLYSFVLNCND